MTKPLYLDDAYAKEFDAKITSIENNKIELDQTLFYPESGGQLGDKGILIDKETNKEYQCTCKKEQGRILHHLNSAEGLKIGAHIHGIIDWPPRYKMMRMHTAAHVLSSIINKETGALITGNQLGQDKSRIDFDLEKFDREQLESFIGKANQEIEKGAEASAYTISRQEAESKPELCKLAKGLPPSIQEIRILKIGYIDEQPDGGTHVKNTREIGKLAFVSVENKGASRRRIYFSLED
jgi:Ser-tRNA(Ala) deacylase AlaX